MNIDQQYILVVEDEWLLKALYEDVLEDVGFKQDKAPYDYELDGWVVHFAATKEEAADLINRFAYESVFLDHNLGGGKTSETLVPQILRSSPDCEIFLTSSDPIKQRAAVIAELAKDNLLTHSSQLKQHLKNDITGLTNFLNSKIRPTDHIHPAGQSPAPRN